MFNKRKRVILTVQEFNEKLKAVKKCYDIHYTDPLDGGLFKWNAYIVDKITNIELTFKDPHAKNKVITYICDKACSALKHEYNGVETYSTLQKYYKIPHVSTKENAFFSVSGILYHNIEYNGTRNYAYGYDMNSAFSWGMLQKMPAHTENGPINEFTRIIKKDEIGFDLDGTLRYPGEWGDYIFKAEDSPFKRFIEVWYKKKRDAKTIQEKIKAKDMLVMCVGFMQRHNFWYRAAIIGHCNRLIINLIKKYPENILLSNTDSIVSTCKIPEIEENLGVEIGQWKFEHEGYFAYRDSNYQWNKSIPTYRGISKSWFDKDFDILKDEAPIKNNFYQYDKQKCQLIKSRGKNEKK